MAKRKPLIPEPSGNGVTTLINNQESTLTQPTISLQMVGPRDDDDADLVEDKDE